MDYFLFNFSGVQFHYTMSLQFFRCAISLYNEPTLNLQYAIACYAGDARYYPDYEDYKSRAVLYAGKTLKLLEQNKNQYSEADILLPRLLAYVLLQDYDAAARTVKRINSICGKYSPAYTLAEEYERLAADGQWLWRVSRKEDAEKDFLLYSVDEWGI